MQLENFIQGMQGDGEGGGDVDVDRPITKLEDSITASSG